MSTLEMIGRSIITYFIVMFVGIHRINTDHSY
jgi:hypothetical protein